MCIHKPVFAILLLQICSIKAQYPYPQAQQMPQMQNYPQQMQQGYPSMQQMSMSPQGMPPIPMPMPIAMSQPRLPVVVMPFRSQKNDKERDNLRSSKKSHRHKRRRKARKIRAQRIRLSSGSESSSNEDSASSDVEFRSSRKTRRSKAKRHQVLTPVISYVTKDGYVVYQKKIKKDQAKEWLDLTNQNQAVDDSAEKSALSVEVGKKSGKRGRY